MNPYTQIGFRRILWYSTMISIICVYNNRQILEDYLLRGLQNQTAKFELILVDNTTKQFASAAKALNHGSRRSKGDYLMFVHQDVLLGSIDWLADVESRLNLLPGLGAAGVAGMHELKRSVMTNLEHGDPQRLAGPIQIETPEMAQTLDECLILVPRSVFAKLEFDEETCDDWHLYAVDYSLSIKKLGYDVYVIPDYVYHLSPGYSMSSGYYRVMGKVLKKHRGDYPVIYTTMGVWISSYSINMNRLIHLGYKLIGHYLRIKRSAKSAVRHAVGWGKA